MGTRADRLSLLVQARRLGATARRQGRPVYENPYRLTYADAWRTGWHGASGGADRPLFQPGSCVAKLYDYLVRHDQDMGLMLREITDGFEQRGSTVVNAGLYHLYRRGLVRRLLPLVTGQRRAPQRYRAVPLPPGVGE